MSREDQRQAVRQLREGLIAQLEQLYATSFETLAGQNLGEGGVARLTQLLLRSREAAITPLQEEIEAPLITRAPHQAASTAPSQTPEPPAQP
ncbi:MAG: hercynine metabolism small protein [Prochlorococcaceae cyanobacterium]